MGFLRILRDSTKIRGDSQGFSGFPGNLYEVSGVSSPSPRDSAFQASRSS